MALGAGLVQPRQAGLCPDAQRSAVRRFHDTSAMRIMALDAVHFLFKDGMVVWEGELRVHVQVARKTGSGVPSRVNDVLAASPGTHVQAARAVTGFASNTLDSDLRAGGCIEEIQPRMRTTGEDTREI